MRQALTITSFLLPLTMAACALSSERPEPGGYTVDGATYSSLGREAGPDAGDADADDGADDAAVDGDASDAQSDN